MNDRKTLFFSLLEEVFEIAESHGMQSLSDEGFGKLRKMGSDGSWGHLTIGDKVRSLGSFSTKYFGRGEGLSGLHYECRGTPERGVIENLGRACYDYLRELFEERDRIEGTGWRVKHGQESGINMEEKSTSSVVSSSFTSASEIEADFFKAVDSVFSEGNTPIPLLAAVGMIQNLRRTGRWSAMSKSDKSESLATVAHYLHAVEEDKSQRAFSPQCENLKLRHSDLVKELKKASL